MTEVDPQGTNILEIGGIVLTVITLIFGRNLYGAYRERNSCESDNFCEVIDEYLVAIENLHAHALKHQGGMIDSGLSCNQSAAMFGGMSKKVGVIRKRLESLVIDEEIQAQMEVLQLRWKEAIFTDRGLMTNKSNKTAESDIEKMEDSKEKLVSFLKTLRVRAKKRKINLQKL